jgi:hypothetical protein
MLGILRTIFQGSNYPNYREQIVSVANENLKKDCTTEKSLKKHSNSLNMLSTPELWQRHQRQQCVMAIEESEKIE